MKTKVFLAAIILNLFAVSASFASSAVSVNVDGVAYTCSPGAGGETSSVGLLCDCVNGSNSKYGEAFVSDFNMGTDIRQQCTTRFKDLVPSNCRKVTGPVVCDCMNDSGVKYGQAFGNDGASLRKQCALRYNDVAPNNCK